MFDAPRELVFSAWSDPNHLRRWWGPKGCSIGFCNMDLRPGGQLLYSLRMPDGQEMWGKFVYREILPARSPRLCQFLLGSTRQRNPSPL